MLERMMLQNTSKMFKTHQSRGWFQKDVISRKRYDI